MKRVIFALLILLVSQSSALSFRAYDCTYEADSCSTSAEMATPYEAANAAQQFCKQTNGASRCLDPYVFTDACVAAAVGGPDYHGLVFYGVGATRVLAETAAQQACFSGHDLPCWVRMSYCDPKRIAASSATLSITSPPNPTSGAQQKLELLTNKIKLPFQFFDIGAIGSGISFGIGIAIALLIFAKRATIANFIIHGNLPLKLPVYGEDIQCLLKRTQRVNWYGRVVFGIVINLSMTHQQFIDVRKYWLGRVIAFDSLRRQRQNQLATMHLQLAAKAKSDAHDKKKFWSRRWATLRSFIKKLFWVVIALFNLVMALFFIRVSIARLVRGAIVESKDLTLILQAKEAIEESTTYLKEYLLTANTFDGRDEIYEPE